MIMRFLGYVWSSPLTLIGLLITLIYFPRSIRWSRGCIEIIPLWILGNPGAQSWGWLIFYCDKSAAENAGLRVHERVHVEQAFIGGVFFALAYAIHWLWLFAFPPRLPRDTPRWFRAYQAVYWEWPARRIQHEYLHGLRPNAWGGR